MGLTRKLLCIVLEVILSSKNVRSTVNPTFRRRGSNDVDALRCTHVFPIFRKIIHNSTQISTFRRVGGLRGSRNNLRLMHSEHLLDSDSPLEVQFLNG